MTGSDQWIAVDWGTTRMRAWRMDGDGGAADFAGGGKGMNALGPAEFEPELLRLVEPWLTGERVMPVLICGMAGARQGWLEAPYMDIPAPLSQLAEHTVAVAAADTRIAPRIVPGLAQRTADRPDVMRGEETQLAGLTAADPEFSSMVCMPGTHNKWVHMADGAVERFTSTMGGEMFALLEQHSILRHSLEPGAAVDASGFSAGIAAARAHEGRLLGQLFGIRAGDLLMGRSKRWNRSYLSGLLIGSELVGALAGYAAEDSVMVIGDAALCERFLEALAAFGRKATHIAGEEATLAGLAGIYGRLVTGGAWTSDA